MIEPRVTSTTSVFPAVGINLNPGTLGTRSQLVRQAVIDFDADVDEAFPLQRYQAGRAALRMARRLAEELWPSGSHAVAITGSATDTINKLAVNLATPRQQMVLSTRHEHAGGIAAFENHPAYVVEYLSDDELEDMSRAATRAEQLRPDVLFLSQLSYDSSVEFQVDALAAAVRESGGECTVIVDAAQSLGLIDVPVAEADFIVASAHKWLFGPPGLGLLWVRRPWLENDFGISWNGEPLDADSEVAKFEPAGGHDFSAYAGMVAALSLYEEAGPSQVLQRSQCLCAILAPALSKLFASFGISASFSSRRGTIQTTELVDPLSHAGAFTVHFAELDSYALYTYLNDRNIHVKCIKKEPRLNALRFGLPYYETSERLDRVVSEVAEYLGHAI